MKNSFLGQCALFGAALIWGSSFIVMKNAVDFLTPASLIAVRFTLATLFMLVIFGKHVRNLSKQQWAAGFITGVCLFLAYYIQTVGLSLTTPGKNAFLTAVYCAIVPFLSWVFYKERPDVYNFLAAFLCMVGIGFVSLQGDMTIGMGDFLTIIGGFFYALHIILIRKYTKIVNPFALTLMQFGSCAICAFVVALGFEDITIVTSIQGSVWLQVLYLAFFATMVSLLLQNMGQDVVEPCRASLLLSLESVFGVFFSVLLYNEVITSRIAIGFLVIFMAIVVSETKLQFLKRE
ncbi:DMT family transporter [Tannockella kyphosi]|uniref:DMT family transporter n=1 Tax=Tannockella kyphosi TaxID=2899121 RepID=UPI00201290C7|nr:DMT family transporter [Tannockella kyphosi]